MQDTNMYTDGSYYKNNPTWDVEDSAWKAKKIAKLVQKNNIAINHITDIGCGAGAVIHELALQFPLVTEFRGYDISPDAIRLANKYSTERTRFYNEDFTAMATSKTDLLLLIDVVEHVEDYYGFLKKLSSRSHYFIFHIPLDLSCRTLLKPHVLLQQREAVGHLHYYSKEMVWWLLKDTGYTIIDWVYTKPNGDTGKSKNLKQGIKKLLRNFSYSVSPGLSDKLWGGYSLMILARHEQA
jgi:SAM-dependent methyltransferase